MSPNANFLQLLKILLYPYILINIISSRPYDGCKFNITDTNDITSEYDLSGFYFSNGLHEVDDYKSDQYEYKFNICGAISPKIFLNNITIPSYCIGEDKGPCLSFKDYDNGTTICTERYTTTLTSVASAVQIDDSPLYGSNPSCHWLGMELDEEIYGDNNPNYDISLLDDDNSGGGIKFTILNGQFCEGGYNMNRELVISMKCPDETHAEFEPDLAQIITEPVYEGPSCVYNIEFESPLACPKQCVEFVGYETYMVCSLHGICAADPNRGRSHCLCDDGYEGELCEFETSPVTVVDEDNQHLETAIIICTVLLLIICGIAVYLCYIYRTTQKLSKQQKSVEIPSNEYFEKMLDLADEDEFDHLNEDNDDDHEHGPGIKQTKDTFHPIVSVDDKIHREITQALQKEIETQNDDDNNNNHHELKRKETVIIDDPGTPPNEIIPGDDEIDYIE